MRDFLQKALMVTSVVHGPRPGWRSMAVVNTGGVFGGRPVRPFGARPKISSTFSGRPGPGLPATSASKNARALRGASNTMVRETSTWRIDNSRQHPASRSAAVSGSGMRDIHRSKNTVMVPGPSRSQVACRARGPAQEANPLDSAVNRSRPGPAAAWPIPAR